METEAQELISLTIWLVLEAARERGSGERAALAQRNAPRGRGHQVRGVPGSGRERNALRPTADPA